MNGGQGRSKHSPGSFFGASRPGLPPLKASLGKLSDDFKGLGLSMPPTLGEKK